MEAIGRMMIVCCAEASSQIYPKGQKRCTLLYLRIRLGVCPKVPNLYTVSLVPGKPVQRWWWFGQQRSHSAPFHQCFWNKLFWSTISRHFIGSCWSRRRANKLEKPMSISTRCSKVFLSFSLLATEPTPPPRPWDVPVACRPHERLSRVVSTPCPWTETARSL